MGDEFITGPQSTWARESHLGARFAKAVRASSVWLQDRPDLVVVGADGLLRQYELTEALEPGRRRNQEYREDRANLWAGASATRSYEPDNVGSTREALQRAATSKAAKAVGYGEGPVGLVIYLNTDLHPFPDCISLLEADLHSDTNAAALTFSEVWVLWAGRLYLVWRDGEAVTLDPVVDA